MIQFFMLKLHLGGCMSPALKFELPIAQEGMVYKIWDSLYKIVQNKYKIVQNRYKIVQNKYKIVQNKYKIMIHFSFSKSVFGGAGDMHL